MNYQPVFSLKTDWIVGVIDNHTAKPLTEYEVTMACEQLNKIPTLVAEVERLQAWQDEIRGAIKRSGMGIMRTSQGPIGTMIGYRPEVEEAESKHTLEVIHENCDLRAQNAALQKRVEELEEDKTRLDTLESLSEGYGTEGCLEGYRWTIEGPFETVRTALDELKAMRAARAQKGEQ